MSWGWDDLFALLALLLVVEGIYPAISPEYWRKMLFKFASAKDNTIRSMGVTSMVLGSILLAIVHNLDNISILMA
tara:strand:+ start:1172 stop:1396 length:225 start_codon:yes stop_codon:yes gene_type:complete